MKSLVLEVIPEISEGNYPESTVETDGFPLSRE